MRRRLFQPIPTDQIKHRDATARAFGEFYRTQSAEFPGEARDPAYVDRMKSAYPIHPELFSRLYEDWSALEGFQRTRGVLRLMAAVISALWAAGDQSPLILPANVPLDDPAVQSELTRNLDHAWQPIIDSDVDGPNSIPRKVDNDFPNLGRYSAARRASRTVFLASAPRSASPNLGVELQRIKLGCSLPGEAVATYGDALNRLTDRSSFLYVEGARFWYGTQASVARRARDLIDQYLSTRREELHNHIVKLLEPLKGERGEFAGVHVCPNSSADVPDEAECRLVVLSPAAAHVNKDSDSQAMIAAKALLEQRSSGARHYRNMLVFLAADQRRLEELERGTAESLAWTEIRERWEELGLDAFGRNQAESKKNDANKAVELRLAETFHWALIPHQPDPTGPIEWDTTKTDGQLGLAARASRKLINDGSLNIAYAAELLRGLLGEGGTLESLWASGHVVVNDVWDAFARYPYLPRLRDINVLTRTVAQGPASITWEQHGFAVADTYDEKDTRYVGLVTGAAADHVTGTTLIVRPDLAVAQLGREVVVTGATAPGTLGPEAGAAPEQPVPEPADEKLRRFYAIAHLDPERYQRDFSKMAQEIVTNLAAHLGTAVDITVEVRASNDDGFPDHIIRTVNENAKTLKLEQFGFERE